MKAKILTIALITILVGLLSSDTVAQCCVAPTNLAVKSVGRREADLQWRRVRQAGCITPVKYLVQYRVLGTNTWASVVVRTHGDDKFGDTTIKSLTPSTTYQWRVQGICSNTNTTAFVRGPNFTTLAAAVAATSSASSVSSSSENGKLAATAYPNPVGRQLNLTGRLKFEGPVDIQLVNSNGQAVYHQKNNFSVGDFQTKIDVSKLTPGVYIIVIYSKGEKIALSVVRE